MIVINGADRRREGQRQLLWYKLVLRQCGKLSHSYCNVIFVMGKYHCHTWSREEFYFKMVSETNEKSRSFVDLHANAFVFSQRLVDCRSWLFSVNFVLFSQILIDNHLR